MSNEPQGRYEDDLSLDPQLDGPGREGLTGTTASELYRARRDPDQITVAPDMRPLEEQPQWRKDFPIDWPQDHYVARRDFAKFLVLISGAFVVGQAWILAKHLLKRTLPPPPRMNVGRVSKLPVGSATTFNFPGEHDPCLMVRPKNGELLAYSQKCTHLSCAVVPKMDNGVLHCPCHEGFFDLYTGNVLAGPPPRPLPKIRLQIVGDEIYALSVESSEV
jgi:Rieske Fe-S protein